MLKDLSLAVVALATLCQATDSNSLASSQEKEIVKDPSTGDILACDEGGCVLLDKAVASPTDQLNNEE